MRLGVFAFPLLALSLVTSPALAEDEAEAPAPSPPAEAPAPAVRLGLDLAYGRATSNEDIDDFANLTPSRIPLGVDLSFRKSRSTLLGLHGHVGIASRSDCGNQSGCFARTYGGGGHVEWLFREGTGFVPWLRYGAGLQVLYRSGTSTKGETRVAFDIIDLRVGGDFVLGRHGDDGRTSRLGPFAGLDLGAYMLDTAASTRGTGTTFAIASLGIRGTLEP